MDIFGILAMVGGLALFLYGMQVLGDGLKRTSGGRLEEILESLTSNKWKGALLGCVVTAVIQSSSATTVMVVGLVNSGIMKLTQAAGVILGANVGTTVTSWMLSLTGIESSNVFVQLLKPANFSPIVGIIGVIMLMTAKNDKKKDIGTILIGFAVLMFGMETMSSAVEPLAGNEKFTGILTMFSNPILGMLAGLVLTAVIQSSSASIGILQALSMSGTLTIGSAIPILMGENIGTAITAILSSMGASKNAKRAALMHLYFCILKTSFFMVLFYLIDAIVHFSFMTELANPFIIAMIHSIFNLSAVIIMLPISEVLVKLAMKTIPVTPDELEDVPVEKSIQILDERFLASPHFALEQCKTAAGDMAEYAREALLLGMGLVTEFHPEQAKRVENLENLVDSYEDQLGTYLVKLSSRNLSTRANQAAQWKATGIYNCAQAVTQAFADQIPVEAETLKKLGAGYAAGMGCMESTCGALIGAVMAAGILTDGKGTPAVSRQLVAGFQEKCGATICKDLKGIETGRVLCSCPECVRNAVLTLGEVLKLEEKV